MQNILTNNQIITAGAALVIVAVGLVLLKNDNVFNNSTKAASLKDVEVVVYKSSACECCGEYISYLKERGAKVAVRETEKMNEVKSRYKIPTLLESCHTSVIGDYVVEGHVPTETIRKLLDEKPAIAGISLSGMPAGSPGMSGTKFAPFRVYSINFGGKNGGVFVEI